MSEILVVDDHAEMAKLVADSLAPRGHRCRIATSGAAAIAAMKTLAPDLVITDLRMAEIDGLDVLTAAKTLDAELPVIVMTAFGAVDTAIEAMRRGAYHYLAKPVRLDELGLHVARALEQRALRVEHRLMRAAQRTELASLVGGSESMRRLYELVERAGRSQAPVLIRGESGTGKELVARAVHACSVRRERVFVAVNCTALPEQLLESELFGHVRGAFTGATSARAGLFAEADGGTLFLDEIGDMNTGLQARLLRAVQEGEIRPLGGDVTRRVDVRVVAATHHDLERELETGEFRADLFYRLDVVPIRVPALRDRRADLPSLVAHFITRSRARNPESPVVQLADATLAQLARYAWPGNVRELENLIERLVVIGTEPEVSPRALAEVAPRIADERARFAMPRDELATLREVEEQYIAWMIEHCGGNKTRAAEQLGIDASTLHRRLKRGGDRD